MKAIWTNYDKTIEVKNGVVVSSNADGYPVGSTVNNKQLISCGWIRERKPKPVYVKGFNGNSFDK